MAHSERECKIVNVRGLHARAAAKLVKTAGQFQAEIFVKKDGREVNGKSIMGILTLAAAKGSSVTLIANGADAQEAIEELDTLIKNGFYEEER